MNNIKMVDAVIITHDHADHTHGMDELRPFGFIKKTSIPVHADELTSKSLRKKFPYIFDRDSYFQGKQILGGGIPLLDLVEVKEGKINISDEEIELFSLPHGHTNTFGIRHENMAYLTDCRSIPENVLQSLSDAKLDILFIDCLRPTPHQTHLHIDLTVEYIRRINPKKAVLIHMGHEWDHLELTSELKKRGVKNTFPAIDGMSFLY